jgi:hypothetical protein
LIGAKFSENLGSSFGYHRNYRYERTVVAAFLELYGAVNQRKQRVVFAHAHVGASVVTGTALTHDDVASDEGLTTEDFNAEALRMRFTAVV